MGVECGRVALGPVSSLPSASYSPNLQIEPRTYEVHLEGARMRPGRTFSVRIITESATKIAQDRPSDRLGELIIERSHEYGRKTVADGIEEYPIRAGAPRTELLGLSHPIPVIDRKPDRTHPAGSILDIGIQDSGNAQDSTTINKKGNEAQRRSHK
jgi:hypothetical protein